jgi:hypothetical protein
MRTHKFSVDGKNREDALDAGGGGAQRQFQPHVNTTAAFGDRSGVSSKPADLDLLVLNPPARIVGLKLDPACFDVLETIVFEDVLTVDANEALLSLHDQLKQEPPLRARSADRSRA